LEDDVFSFTGPSAGLSAAVLAAVALLLPIAVITILTACATAVALAAGKPRRAWEGRFGPPARCFVRTMSVWKEQALTRRGRPRQCSDELLERVVAMRNQGLTSQTICDVLNDEGVPTPAGRGGGARTYRGYCTLEVLSKCFLAQRISNIWVQLPASGGVVCNPTLEALASIFRE
jgi:hypothetical protein